MTDEDKLTAREILVVKATVKEFMDQISKGVGRSILDKLFWAFVGALLFFYFGGHLPK